MALFSVMNFPKVSKKVGGSDTPIKHPPYVGLRVASNAGLGCGLKVQMCTLIVFSGDIWILGVVVQ